MTEFKNESDIRKYIREFIFKREAQGSGIVKKKSKAYDSKSESFLDLYNAIKKGEHTDPDKKTSVQDIITKVKSDLAALQSDLGSIRKG